MKVLFIPLWYPSEHFSSVSGVFCREHVMSVSDTVDIDVIQVTTDPNRSDARLVVKHHQDNTVDTWIGRSGKSPIPKTSFLVHYVNLYRAIANHIKRFGRPDVIHCQDDTVYVVMAISKVFDIPFVMSQQWTKFIDGGISWWEIQLYKLAFRRAARILPVNIDGAEVYASLGLKGNVTWVPNTFNTNIFYPPKEPARDRSFLHASGFSDQKRVADVIEAFKIVVQRHPETHLHFAGSGTYEDKYRQMANAILPLGSFTFHGHVSKQKLADMMRTCAAFVFPSEFETFGCVLMEAMACGIPIVATRVWGTRGVIQSDDEALVVEVGDVPAIATAMQTVLTDLPLDTTDLANMAVQRFSYQGVAKQLIRVYTESVSGVSFQE